MLTTSITQYDNGVSPQGFTKVSPIPVTITFSEDTVDFVAADITLTGDVATTYLTNFAATSATIYTVDIVPAADGAIVIQVDALKPKP